MKAAIMLQYSQAVGFPYALTFASHLLQIDEVLDLLQKKCKGKILDKVWSVITSTSTEGGKGNFSVILLFEYELFFVFGTIPLSKFALSLFNTMLC